MKEFRGTKLGTAACVFYFIVNFGTILYYRDYHGNVLDLRNVVYPGFTFLTYLILLIYR